MSRRIRAGPFGWGLILWDKNRRWIIIEGATAADDRLGEGDREGVEPVQEWKKFGGGDPKDVSED